MTEVETLRALLAEARAEAERDAALAELKRMKERPVEAEFMRLDEKWQRLVVERDDAVFALRKLREAVGKLPWCRECQGHEKGCAHCVGWRTE